MPPLYSLPIMIFVRRAVVLLVLFLLPFVFCVRPYMTLPRCSKVRSDRRQRLQFSTRRPCHRPRTGAETEEAGPALVIQKTRQMNILVYIITRQVLQLMSNSVPTSHPWVPRGDVLFLLPLSLTPTLSLYILVSGISFSTYVFKHVHRADITTLPQFPRIQHKKYFSN